MTYKYAGIDNSYRETVELTRIVMNNHPEKVRNFQMKRYSERQRKMSEETESFLKKLCQDFMSYEFDGIDFAEINYALINQTDEVYQDWIQFATMKGIESTALQQAGWEMIFGGEFSYIPALQKFY